MSTTPLSRGLWFGTLVLALAGGCDLDTSSPPRKTEAPPKEASQPDARPAAAKRVPVGKNVFLEIQGDRRRVIVNAYVCLRKGMLEQLLTRRNTKEHEAILAADVDARNIHTALILAKAKPGATVRFRKEGNKFVIVPPTGTPVKVTLRYKDKNNKPVTVPARRWVRDVKTGKALAHDWVFAGSSLFKDPLDPKRPPLYGANDGDVICVSNFDTALLDLPIASSKDNAELEFQAWTERIPAEGTKVTLVLEPVLDKKRAKR